MGLINIQPASQNVIGFATFYGRLTEEIIQKLQIRKNTQFLQSAEWKTYEFQLTQHEGKSIFSYIKQARCKNLTIDEITSLTMVKQILDVNYTNLISLYFRSDTFNIEMVAFLNLPKLKHFGVLFCSLDKAESLSKICWPNIQTIVFLQNKGNIWLRKIFLNRLKTGDELRNIRIGRQNGDFSFLSKVQAKKVFTVQYVTRDQDPTQQINLNPAFRRKYSQLRIQQLFFK